MTEVLCIEEKNLLDLLIPTVRKFRLEAAGARGDFAVAAQAVAGLLRSAREIAVTNALELATENRPKRIRCPGCQGEATGWSSGRRRVVTDQGAGTYDRIRYRCPRCEKDYYPTEEANGLVRTSYTLEARKTIAAFAAERPYAEAAAQLWEVRGIPVSAKEVDTITREMAALVRESERKLVDAQFGETALTKRVENPDVDPLDSAQALHDMSDWSPTTPALVSVDGGKVRSPEVGERGLEWFECRAGVIAPAKDTDAGRTVFVGGYATADEIFGLLAATYRKSAGSGREFYFVADGAAWIWDRVPLYFPNAVQVLDIYHAGEHVGSAAAAAWGDGAKKANHWRKHARDFLLEPHGVRTVLGSLIKHLRASRKGASTVASVDDLVREIRYLFRHRHRMRYFELHKKEAPIGSGVMESAIKQLSTMRLRLPGMMWTRQGADAVLRLRAAHLSGALDGIVERERSSLNDKAARYCPPELRRAA